MPINNKDTGSNTLQQNTRMAYLLIRSPATGHDLHLSVSLDVPQLDRLADT